ncbi:MAG: hypothetical protein AB1515_01515 [Nitrospirota bacterium]
MGKGNPKEGLVGIALKITGSAALTLHPLPFTLFLIISLCLAPGCGKKGDPLPPEKQPQSFQPFSE